MISLVRAFEESFKTVVCDALASARVGCLLGEPIRRRPVLPGPAPPRRPAVRRPDPTRPWYVRVVDSTTLLNTKSEHAPRAEAGQSWARPGQAGRVGAGSGGAVRPGPDFSFRPRSNVESRPGRPVGGTNALNPV